MIPILYEANETDFTSLGIGPLGDAIKCVVTEELNGEYELEMIYPVSGVHYSDLIEDRLIYAVPSEGAIKQIFKIYQIEKPLDGQVTVRAEHIHYLLNKMVVKPFHATTVAEVMYKLKPNIVDNCPFNFSTDMNTEGLFKMIVPTECGKILGGSEGSILDVYGHGEYEFNNFNVILRSHRGADNGVTIRYGKNLTELNASVDTSTVYTGIVPYYKDSEDNVTYAPNYVVWSDHKNDYAYPLAKVVDFSSEFDEEKEAWEQAHSEDDPDKPYAPTPNDLVVKAREYLTRNAGWNKNNNIKVSFVNLWQSDEYADIAVLERVKLCDTVTIIYQKLGVSTTKKVIKTEYNVLLDRYDSIELGTPTVSMTTEIANSSTAIEQAAVETKSWMQQAIEHATKLITGGLGGYLVINTNAAGNPNELLIMDQPDKTKAVNVWRFNLGGLGHSHSGYNGPFDDVALTMDGEINANMITTGILQANIIKAGILGDDAGINYWDMVTGEFSLSTNTKIGDSTIASKKNVSDGDSNTLTSAKSYSDSGDAATLRTALLDTADSISNYDEALNQLAVFNKLTVNGEKKGISLNAANNELYINASFIATGILTGKDAKFALNMDTGEFNMSDGKLTGVTIQSVDRETGGLSNARVVLDNTTTIKGYYGNDLHNLINFEQVVSETHQMTIDADTQLNIRTPKLGVINQSGGMQPLDVYETVTQLDEELDKDPNYYTVWDLGKIESYEADNVWEGYVVGNENDDWWVYCTLPVYVKYKMKAIKYVNGMLVGDGTIESRVF